MAHVVEMLLSPTATAASVITSNGIGNISVSTPMAFAAMVSGASLAPRTQLVPTPVEGTLELQLA